MLCLGLWLTVSKKQLATSHQILEIGKDNNGVISIYLGFLRPQH